MAAKKPAGAAAIELRWPLLHSKLAAVPELLTDLIRGFSNQGGLDSRRLVQLQPWLQDPQLRSLLDAGYESADGIQVDDMSRINVRALMRVSPVQRSFTASAEV